MLCVRRKDLAYAKYCRHTQRELCTHINKRTNAHMLEQACIHMDSGCVRKNKSAYVGLILGMQERTQKVFLWYLQVFSTKPWPKHVPTPPRVSDFHLNPSQSKTQAFTSLKMDWNERSKEKLKNKKSLKDLLIRPLHPLKGVVVIYKLREESLSLTAPFQQVRWKASAERT